MISIAVLFSWNVPSVATSEIWTAVSKAKPAAHGSYQAELQCSAEANPEERQRREDQRRNRWKHPSASDYKSNLE